MLKITKQHQLLTSNLFLTRPSRERISTCKSRRKPNRVSSSRHSFFSSSLVAVSRTSRENAGKVSMLYKALLGFAWGGIKIFRISQIRRSFLLPFCRWESLNLVYLSDKPCTWRCCAINDSTRGCAMSAVDIASWTI